MLKSSVAIANLSIDLPPEAEQRLLQLCEDFHESARRAQGYSDVSASYRRVDPAPRSWMWWRVCAMACMEKDYRWRLQLQDEFKWSKCNRTMGMFERQVEQHRVELEKNMLRNHRFFSFAREGEEDGTEDEIKLLKRRLHFRSKETKFDIAMRNAARLALPCGEAVIEPVMKIGARMRHQKSKILLLPDGSPALDSKGSFIPSSAEFREVEGRVLLDGDSAAFPKAALIESDQEVAITSSESFNDGAHFSIIHHEDFVCDPRWESLDEAPYRGIIWSTTFDELVEYLSGGWDVHEENLAAYKEEVGSLGSSTVAPSRQAKESMGETVTVDDEDQPIQQAEETQPFITLIKEYVSVDILGIGSLQHLFVLRDPENQKLIAYTFATSLSPWMDKRARHPLRTVLSKEVTNRWYGAGYFKDMFDQIMEIDELSNTATLEVRNSGNAMFMKPRLIKNVSDGGSLLVRGDTPNELQPSAMEAREAFDVITIPAEVDHINGQLEAKMSLFRTQWGQITPGSSGGGLQGLDTAFGMNLVAEKAGAELESRQDCIAKGLDDCVADFITIELTHYDEEDLIDQMDEQAAAAIREWVFNNKGKLKHAIETLLANASDTTALNKHSAGLQKIAEYRQMPGTPDGMLSPSACQASAKDAFRTILLDLDFPDPDKFLETNEELFKRLLEAQPAQAQPGVGIPPQGQPGDPAAPPEATSSGSPGITGPPRSPPTPASP